MLSDARDQTYDLVVVPGVPLENGKWSRTMKARVYWSKYLYDQGIAKNICILARPFIPLITKQK
jgi:hypothetical protein